MVWYAPKVKLGLGQSPFGDPTAMDWTDVSSDVLSFSTRGGFNRAQDTREPSECTITIDNRSGKYTPGNDGLTTNLLHPNVVRPGRLTRDATWWESSEVSGVTLSYNTFFGITTPVLQVAMVTGKTNVRASVKPLSGGAVRVSPSTSYSMQAMAYRGTAQSIAGAVFIDWYTSSMVYISRSQGTASTFGTTVFDSKNVTATSPATAYYAVVGVICTSTTTTTVSMYLGNITVVQSGTPANDLGNNYYGLFVPGTPVQVANTTSAAVEKPVFTGSIDSIRAGDEDNGEEGSIVIVTCTDASKVFSTQKLREGPPLVLNYQSPLQYVTLGDTGNSDDVETRKRPVGGEGSSTLDPVANLRRQRGSGSSDASFAFGQPGIHADAGTSLKLTPSDVPGYGWGLYFTDTSLQATQTAKWTVQGWFRPTVAPVGSRYDLLNIRGLVSPATSLIVGVGSAGKLIAGAAVNDGSINETTFNTVYKKPQLCDGGWHHLVVTYDGVDQTNFAQAATETVKVYIDGVMRAALAQNVLTGLGGTTYQSALQVIVGHSQWSEQSDAQNDKAFDGWLQHWSLHSTVWSPTLVNEVYQGIATNRPWDADSDIARVDRLLDLAGFSTATNARSIPTTVSGTMGALVPDVSVEESLRLVESSFGGKVYIAGNGVATYTQRDTDLDLTTTLVVSEANANQPEAEVEFAFDDQFVANEVTVKDSTGLELTVKDDASIALFGKRTYTRDLSTSDWRDMLYVASWLLYSQKDAKVRMSSLTWDVSTMSDTQWNNFVALAVGTQTRIDLSGILRTSDPDEETVFFVDSVEWMVDAAERRVRVTMELSPTTLHREVLTLDSNTLGQLDLYPLAY